MTKAVDEQFLIDELARCYVAAVVRSLLDGQSVPGEQALPASEAKTNNEEAAS